MKELYLKTKSTHNILNLEIILTNAQPFWSTYTYKRVSILPKSEMRVSCPMPEMTLIMFALSSSMVLGTGPQIHYFFHINNFLNNVQQGIVSQLLLIEA